MALLIHRPSSAASAWPPHTHGRAQSSTHSSTVTHSTARRLHVHARTLVGHITSVRHASEVDEFFNNTFGLHTL